MTKAWEMVKAGEIEWQWRRWVSVADGREFHWSDIETRRLALIECAEHVNELHRSASKRLA